MPLSTQPYKGARDFYPEDKRTQKYLFDVLRQTVEKFGYEEYDAPIIEPLDLYLAKTGEEIVNEQTYAFTDRGGRQVALRPEMTPSVSRMVAARRQELSYPLRWYSIPNLWRYERPQRGRLREHWQLNVDIFGVSGPAAEHEIILVADELFRAFKATRSMYTIKLNSRLFTDYMLREYLGFDTVQAYTMAKLIDRMHKLDNVTFMTQLDAICTPHQREQGIAERLQEVLKACNFSQLPVALQSHPAVDEVRQVVEMLTDAGVTNVEFDPTLMRGFDYYTGIVFEVFDTHPDNNRAMMGGGRYDGLVGLFGVDPVPTVGFGLGDVTLANFLELHGLLPALSPEVDACAIIVGDVWKQAQKPLAEMRKLGLNVAVDLSNKKVGQQLQAAARKNTPYAIIIGEDEIKTGHFTLRDLLAGTEEKHGIERLVSIAKDHRRTKPGDDDLDV